MANLKEKLSKLLSSVSTSSFYTSIVKEKIRSYFNSLSVKHKVSKADIGIGIKNKQGSLLFALRIREKGVFLLQKEQLFKFFLGVEKPDKNLESTMLYRIGLFFQDQAKVNKTSPMNLSIDIEQLNDQLSVKLYDKDQFLSNLSLDMMVEFFTSNKPI